MGRVLPDMIEQLFDLLNAKIRESHSSSRLSPRAPEAAVRFLLRVWNGGLSSNFG